VHPLTPKTAAATRAGEGVNHVSGMFCKPCVRSGPSSKGPARRGSRAVRSGGSRAPSRC